jgi:hypothetical protein
MPTTTARGVKVAIVTANARAPGGQFVLNAKALPGIRREAKRTDDADVARRMLALALVLEGKSRGEAARSCGMDRQFCAIGCTATMPQG